MKILGIKLATWRQWLEVIKAEGRSIRWGQMMILAIHLPFTTNREMWKERYRTCWKCPIFTRATRQCKRAGLGCNCWMPLKAMPRAARCWAKEQNPDGSIGWKR